MGRKKGVVFSYIFMALETLSGVLFTPYLIRCLGQEEYGLYGLVASITSYLILLDLGVGNAIVKYMAKFRINRDKKSERNMMGITLFFYTVIGAIIISVGFVLRYFIPDVFGTGLTAEQQARAQAMLRITVLNCAVTLFFLPAKNTIIAYEKFVLSKCIDIAKVIIRVSLCFFALYFGGKGLAVVTINMIVNLITGIICMIIVMAEFKIIPRLSKIEKGFIKEIIGYSSFIMIQMIAAQINGMVDHILIGAFVASSAVILGIYTAGAQISTYFQSFGSAINGVLMPGVVRLVEKNSSKSKIETEMIKVSRISFMFLGLIWVGFLTQGQKFMCLWAGNDNRDAYYVSVIIMTPMLISLSQSIGTQILWAMNKHKVQALLKIGISVVNIFLTVILIKWKPLIGASIGTGIALFAGDVLVMNIVFKKDIGISLVRFNFGILKGILPSLLVSGAVGFVVSYTFKSVSWFSLIIGAGAVVSVYAVCLFAFGMNRSEKLMIKKMPVLRKVFKSDIKEDMIIS